MFWDHVMKIVCYMPSSILLSYMVARMLKVNHRRQYMFGINLAYYSAYTLYAIFISIPWAQAIYVPISLSIYALGALAFSKESWLRRIMALGIEFLIMLTAEAVSVLFFSVCGGKINELQIAAATEIPALYIFFQTINFAVAALLCFFALQLWERSVERMENRILWYYTLFPLSQGVLLFVVGFFVSENGLNTSHYVMMTAAAIFCLIVDVLLFRSMRQLTEKAVAEEQAAWSEHLLLQQQSYYAQILSDTEDASRIRHDIRNQLQTAYSLMQSGDIDAATGQLDGISRRLERSASFCANKIVNAILSVKSDSFAEAGIALHCHCDVPEPLPFDGVELCSLFSNVLDNAYRAAASVEKEPKTVELTAGIRRGYFILTCTNPTPEAPPRRSGKGHGLGLGILRDLAEKYNGELKTEQENGTFKTTIWLQIPEGQS